MINGCLFFNAKISASSISNLALIAVSTASKSDNLANSDTSTAAKLEIWVVCRSTNAL